MTTKMDGSKSQDLTTTMQIIAAALFRVFDTDHSGVIDSSEMNEIFSSWLVTLLNLATDTILMVEDLVRSQSIQGAATEIAANLRGLSWANDVAISDVIEQLLLALPDDWPNAEAPASSQSYPFQEALLSILPNADELVQAAADKFSKLWGRLEEQAAAAPLNKERSLAAAEPVLNEIAELFLAPDAAESAANAVGRWADGLFRHCGGPPDSAVPRWLVAGLCDAVAEKLRSYVRQGGLTHLAGTLLALVDVNEDGTLSPSELADIGRTLAGLGKVGAERPRFSPRRLMPACALVRG